MIQDPNEFGDLGPEFRDLSELVSEFHVIDRSHFPFRALSEEDFRILYGLPLTRIDDENEPPHIRGNRGNYVATTIQANLRVEVCRIPNRSKNLSALLDLPLELILEIFEHLHPLDLYNMIRTTKSMRDLLLIRKASSLWETVFHRYPEILPCPSDVSPPKWASLLFGPAICDICHHSKAMVDFTYRQRLCDECSLKHWLIQAHMEFRGDIFSKYPNELESLWRLVRYTYRTKATVYPMEYEYLFEPRYCHQDLLMREKEMIPYLSAIEENTPNAREDYRIYKAKTRATILEYLHYVRACNNWSLSIWRVLEQKYRDKLFAFCSMSCSRLIKLGHNPVDVEATRPDIADYYSTYFEKANYVRFSKKELYKHLPVLEAMARNAKEQRILEERRQLIRRREDKISTFYKNVCQPMLEPDIWECLPDNRRILNLGPVLEYTNAAGEGVGDFSPQEVQVAAINFVNTWIPEKKHRLVRTLMYCHPTIEPHGEGDLYYDESYLELATAVFAHPRKSGVAEELCHNGTIVIGWDEARLHLSCAEDKQFLDPVGDDYDFDFSEVAYNAIVLLLRVLGLDPETALAKDVSALNKRFICMNCSGRHINGAFGTCAMDWKECASHAVVMRDVAHETPSYALLSDELTESVLYHEPVYPHPGDRLWSCKHCSHHFNPPVRKKQAILHVKASHAIVDPVEDTDFFYRRHRTLPRRKQYFLGREENSNCRCLVCEAPPTRQRLWLYDSLMTHLSHTHGVQDIVEHVHWKRLRLISKTTDQLDFITVDSDVERV